MTSNKQTQGFGRVVFGIPALVAGEVALLSKKVIKLIQSNQLTLVTEFIEKFNEQFGNSSGSLRNRRRNG